MKDFILIMHSDTEHSVEDAAWPNYINGLIDAGIFDGGSAIGDGDTFRKSTPPAPLSHTLSGFIRIRAASLSDAETHLLGNPVYQAGGTVEIRELPKT